MIAGGAERGITPIALAPFDKMHALSRRNDDPQGASCPFDATRDGFVMGEGSGMLILEELDFAKPVEHNPCRDGRLRTTADAYHVTEPAQAE